MASETDVKASIREGFVELDEMLKKLHGNLVQKMALEEDKSLLETYEELDKAFRDFMSVVKGFRASGDFFDPQSASDLIADKMADINRHRGSDVEMSAVVNRIVIQCDYYQKTHFVKSDCKIS